jgi:hypothetical protein
VTTIELAGERPIVAVPPFDKTRCRRCVAVPWRISRTITETWR